MGSEKDKEKKSIGKIRNECRNGGREKLHRTTKGTMHTKKKKKRVKERHETGKKGKMTWEMEEGKQK